MEPRWLLAYRSALGVEIIVSDDGNINSARDGFPDFGGPSEFETQLNGLL